MKRSAAAPTTGTVKRERPPDGPTEVLPEVLARTGAVARAGDAGEDRVEVFVLEPLASVSMNVDSPATG
jgi:hypothetical protein